MVNRNIVFAIYEAICQIGSVKLMSKNNWVFIWCTYTNK